MNKFFLSTIIAIIVAFFISGVSVYADEYEVDPVQEDFIQESEPEVIADLPVTAAPEIDQTPVTYNFAVNAALSDFKSCLVLAASDHDTEIIFPDNFDSEVSDYFDIILIQKGDPEFFKSIFISLILDSLGITSDSPLYDYFYDIIADYYDDMTGITQQRENNALGTLCFCVLGSISLLGFVKWVI